MKDKKRLVYILHNMAVGGVEMALLSAIPALHVKYTLKIVVLGTIDPQMIRHLTADEKSVFTTFNYPLYLYPIHLPGIIRHILRFKPDLMICSLWRASLAGYFTKKLNPAIRFFSFNHNTRFPHKLSYHFTRLAVRTADVVLTDSSATTRFIQEQLRPAAPVREVSFMTRTTPAYTERDPIRPGEEVRFIFLGRISPVKIWRWP